jgi:hypothetical protein
MNQKKTLEELSRELERQKTERYDIVVPGDALKVSVDVGTNIIKMDVPNLDGTTKRCNITKFAHEQISAKTGIPLSYYEKMQSEKTDLLATNINAWMPDKEKRLVRVLDGNVRAMLSDRYRIIDNYDILLASLEELTKIQKTTDLRVIIKECSLTEAHMYIKITSPDITGEVFHFKGKTEPVEAGIIISNSEVGAGAFRVEPFINVLICQNGMIGEHKLSKVHLGKERGIGVIDWSDATLEYQDMTLWSELKDLITGTFNSEVFNQWLNKINGIASTEIAKPMLAVDHIIKRYDLPKSIKDDLINQFMKETPTQWGLSMAVTQIAQKQQDYEKQITMERIGSKILEEPAEVYAFSGD